MQDERTRFRSTDEAAGYLAAMIDGEGCVSYAAKGNSTRRAVRIANTDRAIIEACLEACELLGIRPSVHASAGTNRAAYVVNIGSTRNLKRLEAMVTLRAPLKAEKLREASAHRTRNAHWHRDDRPLEQLRRLYVDEELSVAETARRMRISESVLRRWLTQEGIPIRPHPWSKLSPVAVRTIREWYPVAGLLQREWADAFGVAPTTICGIVTGVKRKAA